MRMCHCLLHFWLVTTEPGWLLLCLGHYSTAHRGRVSGTQAQWCRLLLGLVTSQPSTPACSAVRWCSGHNLGILGRGPLGPFCGWGTLAGPCGCRSWLRTCSESCSSGSVLTAGGCRARWCSLSPLEGCAGHSRGFMNPWIWSAASADSRSGPLFFGCQQDKPSASLVTTNRTSMCIDLQMCIYSCMLLIVFCWE